MSTQAGEKRLFLTLDEVESTHHVVQCVCRARKHPDNPLLPLGRVDEWDATQARPWESRTVLYDEEDGLFKTWYGGTDVSTERWWATGYATSQDGVHWTKPRLGLLEYNGSKENNLCLMGWGPVIKDAREPDPGRRYKMIVKGPKTSPEQLNRIAYSPDGLRWTEGEDITLPEWTPSPNPDIVVFLDDADDDPDRRFKMVWQHRVPSTKWGPETVRGKSIAFSPDAVNWTASDANPILTPDEGLGLENHFLMLGRYGKLWVTLYECGWYIPNGMGRDGLYAADVRLAVSEDCERFSRVNRHQAVIPRGTRGAWDDGFLVISDKWIIRDDTIFLYYCGQGEDWSAWPGQNTPDTYPYDSTGCIRLSRMGLATLRLDGFTCMETVDREVAGHFTTTPLELPAGATGLTVNVGDVQHNRSFVRIEALDPNTDRPIPGYSCADSVDVDTDSVRAPVAWRNASFAGLAGRTIKLRFHLIGAARLYSYSLDA